MKSAVHDTNCNYKTFRAPFSKRRISESQAKLIY